MRFIVLGALACALAMPCAAQWQRNIPSGDYAQTCRDIHNDGNRLEAECQTRDGNWRRTSLDRVDQCGGGITNNDGHLQCAVSGNGYPNNGYAYPNNGYNNGQGNIPAGDYAQTCRDIRAEGNQLRAECQKRDGGWRRTRLDNVDQCGSGVINNDGQLQCAVNGNGYPNNGYNNGQGNVPPGDYVQTCRNIHTHGDRLEAECQNHDGDWRRTSLDDADRCGGPIRNDDGRLVCRK